MKDHEIKELVSMRKFIIDNYNRLDRRAHINASIMKQSDAAEVYEKCIKAIDNLLKDYVKFE